MSGVRKGGWHLREGERGQGVGGRGIRGLLCCTNEGSRVRPYIQTPFKDATRALLPRRITP